MLTTISLITALATIQGPPQIVLEPEDKAAYPSAPAGFDIAKESSAKGTVETVEYDSKSVGVKRKMVVYTPPGYDKKTKLPVLYLLHGIGGTEREWLDAGAANIVLDNLYAEKKIKPMIVVMPNGRAQANDRAEGDVFRTAPAFGEFDKDLLGSIIPFMESTYAVIADRDHRALAGLSMGGGQSLNFGLANPDTFGFVGGFSSAPNTFPVTKLLSQGDKLKTIHYLWVSCGDKDGLFGISRGVHKALKEEGIEHVWHVDAGPHSWPVWKNDLYHFTQHIF